MRMSSKASSNAGERCKATQPYVYRPAPKGSPLQGESAMESSLEALWKASNDPSLATETPEAEVTKREQQAWEKGLQEGEAHARATYNAAIEAERSAVTRAIGDFANERTAYYQRLETEVVQLALAIAGKILHRESQVDPLLLAGVVHVALEKLDTDTTVRLRVHPDCTDQWRTFFGRQVDLRIVPELVSDVSLGPDQCVLETALGSTELSLETQLKEIELGFFDLLAQRPKAA